ncbi:unnamed protein product, partial [Ilex paraguariensis]
DIFVLENQIPFILLEEIQKAIRTEPPCANDNGKTTVIVSNDAEKWSVSDDAQVIYNFCEAHSPLKLMENRLYQFEHRPVHLLDYMYHLIKTCYNSALSLGIGGPAVQALQKHIQFIQALPWENIRSLFQKIDIDGNQNPVEDIEIPSVSSLQKTVGIRFTITELGIRGIKFDEKNTYLTPPCDHSE